VVETVSGLGIASWQANAIDLGKVCSIPSAGPASKCQALVYIHKGEQQSFW